MQTEVIIIGARPTGLALACQFVRYGIDFSIVDKKEGVTPTLKRSACTPDVYSSRS